MISRAIFSNLVYTTYNRKKLGGNHEKSLTRVNKAPLGIYDRAINRENGSGNVRKNKKREKKRKKERRIGQELRNEKKGMIIIGRDELLKNREKKQDQNKPRGGRITGETAREKQRKKRKEIDAEESTGKREKLKKTRAKRYKCVPKIKDKNIKSEREREEKCR